jgi:hypothetical protein
MQTEVQRRIQRLDQARCDAMLGEDYERLASLLSDDLLFVHSNGYAHDKAGYLAFLAEKVRTLDIHRPSAPAFKHVGAAILVCGPLDQILERRAEGQRIEVTPSALHAARRVGISHPITS